MSALDAELQPALAERELQQLYRRRRTLESPQQPKVRVNGRDYLGFSSNDYLGLAEDPRVAEAMREGIARFGVGSGASHLVLGHSEAHHQLEEALAEFTGRERVLLFSTGYMANLGVISALAGAQDRIFQDRLNHASLLDGGKLSGARSRRYRHADPDSLSKLLSKPADGRTLVVTDGVFSMDGDIAPLPALTSLCEKAGAYLVVDDAHGFGAVGETGGGVAEQYGLDQSKLPVLIGTLGKAFGTSGAFVSGSHSLIEYLIQFARPYIYTTALPPAVAHATIKSLELVRTETWRRTHLQQLIQQFRAGALELGYELMPSETPIQPIMIGEAGRALALSQSLEDQGLFVGAIRPPTVPQGESRLRVTLSATHSVEDVDRLLDALGDAKVGLNA